MSIRFISYSSSKVKQEKRALLNVSSFSDDFKRARREEALLSQALSYAQNGSTKLYAVKNSKLKGILGFIALSASEILIDDIKKPVVLIDFLFVNKQYRSKKYKELGNIKVSQILLEYAISKFYEVRECIGVNYLVLYPEKGRKNKNLVSFYKSMGFEYATKKHEWMYVKL